MTNARIALKKVFRILMAKWMIKPAYEDPDNSVDLFDSDRRNRWGEMFCVAPGILHDQAKQYWAEYLRGISRHEKAETDD